MYKNVVIGSGGVNGIFLLTGALSYLYENNLLESVEHYVGCSAGGVIILLFLCGLTPKDMISECLTRYFCDWGFHSCSITKGIRLREFLQEKVGNTKFGDLGPKVTIASTNLSKGVVKYLNNRENPEITIVEVCLMTCSIPIVFPPVFYNGDLYVDGAVKDSFPIHIVPKEGTLAIRLRMKEYTQSQTLKYLKHLIQVVANAGHDETGYECLVLEKCNIDNFLPGKECSVEERVQLYLCGYDQCSSFIKDKEECLKLQ